MLKYFLIGVSVLAVAASGAALTDLGNLDNPGVSKEGSTLLYSSASRADEIYMDQSYEPDGYTYVDNGLSIYGGANYESADDFLPEDDTTVQEVVIWISGSGMNIRVDFFEGSSSGPGDAPPADFYNEEVSAGDIAFEATGDYLYGYPIIKTTIPISDAELTGERDYYWFGCQNTTGSNTFWWAFRNTDMGGPYWEQTYFYYISYWTPGSSVFGYQYDHFYEIWGSTGPPDEEDPTITNTYPMDDDYPSGIPPDENFAGCHWEDGDPETNKGIDVEASTFDIYDADMGLVLGTLTIDDADLWDVIVDFEAEDPFDEGATYTVETETFDLAGNSATELWTFTTGYLSITEASFGAIKAGFAQ
jgi:hypothetical protein